MNAAIDTGNDTLSHAIASARRAGVLVVLIFAAAVLWVSVAITVPKVAVISGVVRAGAPVVYLRHPQPAHLTGISVSLGDTVRRGDVVLELIQVSAAEATRMVSPVDGTVTELGYVAPGTLIPAFDAILEITPIDSAPLIELEVDPVHAGRFEVGSVVPMAAGNGPAARAFSARVLSLTFREHRADHSTAMRVVLEPKAVDPGTAECTSSGQLGQNPNPSGRTLSLGKPSASSQPDPG